MLEGPSLTELASFVGQGILSGSGADPQARIEQLMNVTEARVQAAAARIFQARQSSLVVIGKPDKRAQSKLEAAQQKLGA